MREITQIEKYQVEIWRRPYQRSLNLTVKPDGLVRVTCGRRISHREITRFVFESEFFIQKRVLEIEALKMKFPAKQYVSGERFLFFGEEWPLEVIWTWNRKARVRVVEKHFEMLAPVGASIKDRQKAVNGLYRRQARLHLHERVDFLKQKMSLYPKVVSIRGQKTRWGSCSADGSLSLNWKLLAAPLQVIDYVVIHELAHIRFLNHSPRFWGLVERFQSDWKESRRWLKEHEHEIGVQFQAQANPPGIA